MYNISIDWLTRNRRRIKINVLTGILLGVYIHRNIKHAKRIMGSEDRLNNYYREGYTRIN